MTDVSKTNITLEEYLKLLKQMKSAALNDMDTFPDNEMKSTGSQNMSALGLSLRYRDDEDCLYADCSMEHQLFTRLHPYLWEEMKEESNDILKDQDLFQEPAENKFYWEVIKYLQIQDKIYIQYKAAFSLKGKILSVKGNTTDFKRLSFKYPEYETYFTDDQKFILDHADQLLVPDNVVLPYAPGDILYIDANPFGKPFYVVYCGETAMDQEYFEWTKKEYGYFKREHPCLYISEEQQKLKVTSLTGDCLLFTDDISFPYAPLDRIQTVDDCEEPLLMEAAERIKTTSHNLNLT